MLLQIIFLAAVVLTTVPSEPPQFYWTSEFVGVGQTNATYSTNSNESFTFYSEAFNYTNRLRKWWFTETNITGIGDGISIDASGKSATETAVGMSYSIRVVRDYANAMVVSDTSRWGGPWDTTNYNHVSYDQASLYYHLLTNLYGRLPSSPSPYNPANTGAHDERTKLYSVYQWTTTNFAWATNCYLDLTKVKGYDAAVTALQGTNAMDPVYQAGGVLVSPSFIICAQHMFGGISNSGVIFLRTNNAVVLRSIIDSTNWGDITLAMLNTPVTDIAPAKYLPTTVTNKLSSWNATNRPFYYATTTFTNRMVPAIPWNQYRILNVRNYKDPGINDQWIEQGGVTYHLPSWYFRTYGGDSSNPAFLLINNDLVFGWCWYTFSGGPWIGPYSGHITNAMSVLNVRHGRAADADTLTPVDLSGWPNVHN